MKADPSAGSRLRSPSLPFPLSEAMRRAIALPGPPFLARGHCQQGRAPGGSLWASPRAEVSAIICWCLLLPSSSVTVFPRVSIILPLETIPAHTTHHIHNNSAGLEIALDMMLLAHARALCTHARAFVDNYLEHPGEDWSIQPPRSRHVDNGSYYTRYIIMPLFVFLVFLVSTSFITGILMYISDSLTVGSYNQLRRRPNNHSECIHPFH